MELKDLQLIEILFGNSNFLMVNNNDTLSEKAATKKFNMLVKKGIGSFIRRPVKNFRGKNWIKKQKIMIESINEAPTIIKKDNKVFNRLNKTLPKYINSFPIDKKQIVTAILKNNKNLNKIIRIIHKEIRKKLKLFLKRNKNKKFVILDIPLFLENKIDSNKDILIYVKSKKKDIVKRLTKRKDFNKKIYDKFKKIQLKGDYKK